MHRCLSLALLLAPPATLAAQDLPAGTITMQMRVHLPDSLKTPIPLGNDINVQMSIMSDGHRLAMEVVPGASVPMLAGMRVLVTFTLGADSVHVGILLPPDLAASAGGSTGMRLDLPIATLGGANPLVARLLDSIGRTVTDSGRQAMPHPTYRSLGSSATVAGITCEEWEVVIQSDTIQTCVIPTPPALLALQQHVMSMPGVQRMMARIPGVADMRKEAYGGREMTAIRTENSRRGLHIELTSYRAGVPDATRLELPAGLQPMSLPMAMPAKPSGGGRLP